MIDLSFINFIVYFFLIVTSAAGLTMIMKDNPIHAALSLIGAFCGGAILLLINNAEFLAFIILTVYVGAVMVLFLFVVMMIDVDKIHFTKNSLFEKISAIVIGGILCSFLLFSMKNELKNKQSLIIKATENSIASINNKKMNQLQPKLFGKIIYSSEYSLIILIASLILFVAIIGAVSLTIREKAGLKKQNLFSQLLRSRENTLEIKKVTTGSGIDDE
jgi:NADH-quinone oxidoreductase subunit J